jgi:transcriptional regulator with XRE-family HTH domain
MTRPSKNPMLMEAFASEIKARRLELQLTQEDLAARCELDRPYISLIEVARKQPTLSVLWRLALGLELSTSEFVARIDDRYERATAAESRRATKTS